VPQTGPIAGRSGSNRHGENAHDLATPGHCNASAWSSTAANCSAG
jgi:hypothetical protein